MSFSFLVTTWTGVVVCTANTCLAAEWTGCSSAACLNDESAAPSPTSDVQVLDESCKSRALPLTPVTPVDGDGVTILKDRGHSFSVHDLYAANGKKIHFRLFLLLVSTRVLQEMCTK